MTKHELEQKAQALRQEYKELNNSIEELYTKAYSVRYAEYTKGEASPSYRAAVAATDGEYLSISNWLLANTPEGKAWHRALARLNELQDEITKADLAVLRASASQVAYLVLAINEVHDDAEYSSRVEVTTQVFGPFATLGEAKKKVAGLLGGRVITTYDGVPDTTVFRRYGNAEQL